ncbi:MULTISPECIES: PilZ domain-containing protein [unclassified Thioalkalivibrio]|uniref:PilZ domain-containing protein n=1 Tax=unclassified Thioalkalivibrio TaxID=2621013 RepID=UPI000374C967|nr:MULTISPECIES: PilZ domain-containing protein [unclassified Thioalkalivibrio]
MNDVLPKLPTRTAGPESFPHRQPRSLRQWCRALPSADPESAFSHLRQALRELNGLALEPGVRFSLITLLEEPLLPLLQRTGRSLSQRTLPLGPRSLKRAREQTEALDSLLTAWLLIAREHEGQKERSAQALQAAMALNASLAVHHWRLYQPLPDDFWRRTYAILSWARERGLTQSPPQSDSRYGPLSMAPVETLAARLMMLGGSAPNALEVGEVDLLARWLDRISLSCADGLSATRRPDLPVLCAALDSNHPPGLTLREHARLHADCCVGVGPALDQLRETPGLLEPHRHTDERSLTERLLRLWSQLPTRQHSRETTEGQHRLCLLGLDRIHHCLFEELEQRRRGTPGTAAPPPSNQVPRDTDRVGVYHLSTAAEQGSDFALVDGSGPERPQPELKPLTTEPPDPAAAAWENVSRGLESARQNERRAPIVKRHPPEHWTVDDIGAGGVRLRLAQPRQPLLIGDLVALRHLDGHDWTIGVLRWIRYDSEIEISIGVEFLAERGLPVQLQDYRNRRAAGRVHPGLFASTRSDRRGAALFMPAQVFDHENRIVCWLAGRPRVLELDNERTGTTLFTEAGCRMTDLTLGRRPPNDMEANEAVTDPAQGGLSLTPRERNNGPA